jgi:predicted ATPase
LVALGRGQTYPARLLEHLLAKSESIPLLLCLVSRPEPESPAARLCATAARRHGARYTELVLAPLSPDETSALIHGLLDATGLTRQFCDLLMHRTEGNPFFLEEVVRSLIAHH